MASCSHRPLAGNPDGLNEHVALRPGDEVPPSAASAGERIWYTCGGGGSLAGGERCQTCGGSSRIGEPVSAGE